MVAYIIDIISAIFHMPFCICDSGLFRYFYQFIDLNAVTYLLMSLLTKFEYNRHKSTLLGITDA